jgi:hypothetical protein
MNLISSITTRQCVDSTLTGASSNTGRQIHNSDAKNKFILISYIKNTNLICCIPRSFLICTCHQVSLVIKKNEMGGACGMYGDMIGAHIFVGET